MGSGLKEKELGQPEEICRRLLRHKDRFEGSNQPFLV